MGEDIFEFFLKPRTTAQKRYEALRAHYVDKLSPEQAAACFGYTLNSFRALDRHFKQGQIKFFIEKKTGPKKPQIINPVQERIVDLRKKNKSVYDIYDILKEEEIKISETSIRRILRSEGFTRLPRRTDRQRGITKKKTIIPKRAQLLDFATLPSATHRCQVAGIYTFIPFILRMDLESLVNNSTLPGTSCIPALNHLLSVLALKLIGGERLSHINNYNLDTGFGFFAGMNVLPKATTLSTYSYGIDKQTINAFMQDIVSKIKSLDKDNTYYGGKTINLDFHAVPHWGEEISMENNWCGARNQSLKSAQTFFAHDGESTMLNYVNADIRRADASNEILRFVDHWINVKGVVEETLVFDSRLTNYDVLGQLAGDKIKFLSLRRRGAKMVDNAFSIPDEQWENIKLDIPKRKHNKFKAFQHTIPLPGHDINVNEIIIKEHGRLQPTFMITNNFDLSIETAVTLYARRWRIENTISDLVHFFNLNSLSSPVAIRIHFDVLMSMLAHTIYKLFARELNGYEKIKPKPMFSKFINTTGKVIVEGDSVIVRMRKNAHAPVIKSNPTFRKAWPVPWWGGKRLGFEWV